MEQLKPIEPGCLCIVINSNYGNSGQQVVALKHVGIISYIDLPECDSWKINKTFETPAGSTMGFAPTSQLMRIDGDWEGKETEVEETLKED